MLPIAYPVLPPFNRGDRVEIPAMRHLGTGRVIGCNWVDDIYVGRYCAVSIKLARGDVMTVTATRLRAA